MKINESHVIANAVAEVVNIFKKAELKPELDKMQAAVKNLEKTFKAKGYEQQGTYEFGGLKGHFWKIDVKDFDLAKDIIKGEIAKASLKEAFIEEDTDELDAEMMHIYQLVLDAYPDADPEEVKEAVIVTFYEIEEYNEFNLREEEVVSRIAEVLGLNKITESVDLDSQEVYDLEYVLAKYGWELVEVTKRNVGKFYKTEDVDSPVLFVNLTNMSIANPEVLEDEALNELKHYL